MTIEEILDMSAAELEAMTDEQLLAYFSPCFNVTRPELAPKPAQSGIPRRIVQTVFMDPAARSNIQKLAALGIDVSAALKRK